MMALYLVVKDKCLRKVERVNECEFAYILDLNETHFLYYPSSHSNLQNTVQNSIQSMNTY
jgi:hypothetical protein